MLILRLCDDDYGYLLKFAAEKAVREDVFEEFGEDAVLWKKIIIQVVVSEIEFQEFLCSKSPVYGQNRAIGAREYLEDRLAVYFCKEYPTYDGIEPINDAGGSVLIDFSNKPEPYISLF